MLSTVTLNFCVTKIVMNSSSQLSALMSVSNVTCLPKNEKWDVKSLIGRWVAQVRKVAQVGR